MNKTIIMLTTLIFILGTVVIHSYGTKHNIKETDMADTHKNNSRATFAGGCFWCVESDFEKIPGVIEAISGYSGGPEINPTYKEVSYGRTGHVEAVQVLYDPEKTNYTTLLDIFWKHIDPTDPGGQFADRGTQYKTVIFYHDDEQKKSAEKSRADLHNSGRFNRPVVTEVKPFEHFYLAEDYHQDYYKKNPSHYKTYRIGSGRDRFIEKTWGNESLKTNNQKPEGTFELTDKEGRIKSLTPLQRHVTQGNGTEPPFQNKFWDNKSEGIYVDIVSGEPLFSSKDKFKSGTGWPSFTAPLEKANIAEKSDNSLFMKRIEVRSTHADSHLGHVFPDGPKPSGLRYCINSASLRFVSKENLKKEGYGNYVNLFSEN